MSIRICNWFKLELHCFLMAHYANRPRNILSPKCPGVLLVFASRSGLLNISRLNPRMCWGDKHKQMVEAISISGFVSASAKSFCASAFLHQISSCCRWCIPPLWIKMQIAAAYRLEAVTQMRHSAAALFAQHTPYRDSVLSNFHK